MIKVLNIISDTNIGGAGRCLMNYLKYYDRDKYEVKVVLPENSQLKPELEKLGTPILEVAGIADQSFSVQGVKALRKVIKAERPDIVHTHGAMSGRIAAKGTGAKIVFTRHSAFPVPDRIKKQPGRFVYKTINEFFADRIIAVSEASKENLTDGGIDPSLIHVMMNGVEPVARIPDAERNALRTRYGVSEADFLLGILARIEDYKGHLYIVEAVKRLKDQGRKVKLLIAGEGGFEPTVREKVKELGLEKEVIFAGFVKDVAPVLSILDLQLNASYGTETSSLSILEGLSMGLPAVVSDYGGNPWLIDDGEDGSLFPSKNSAALAERIGRIMDEPETLARMQVRSKEIYSQRFTGEIFARNVEAVYDRAMEV